jgi:hypothetical protein
MLLGSSPIDLRDHRVQIPISTGFYIYQGKGLDRSVGDGIWPSWSQVSVFIIGIMEMGQMALGVWFNYQAT